MHRTFHRWLLTNVYLACLRMAVAACGLTTEMVNCPVARCRYNPAGWAWRKPCCWPMLKRGHKCLLDRFLRDVDVAKAADQDSNGTSGVGAKQVVDYHVSGS